MVRLFSNQIDQSFFQGMNGDFLIQFKRVSDGLIFHLLLQT
jgi:hypothetical protein